jgi:hypothetical protein
VPESGWPLPGGPKGGQGDIVNCPHRVGGMGRHIQTAYLAKNVSQFTMSASASMSSSASPARPRMAAGFDSLFWLAIGRHFSQNAPLTQPFNLHGANAVPVAASSFSRPVAALLFRPWIHNSMRCHDLRHHSDRFWLLELRVSQQISTFYVPSVQTMDTQLGARHRRRTPPCSATLGK